MHAGHPGCLPPHWQGWQWQAGPPGVQKVSLLKYLSIFFIKETLYLKKLISVFLGYFTVLQPFNLIPYVDLILLDDFKYCMYYACKLYRLYTTAYGQLIFKNDPTHMF